MSCHALLALLLTVADANTPALPKDWHGTWAGQMVSTGRDGKAAKVAITLKVEPIKGTRGVTWVVTYGEGAKALVKDYKLLPDGDKPGRFRLDEGGGVALNTRLVGGVLYSHFETAGAVLTGRYELRDGALRFEVTSARPAAEKGGKAKVRPYDVDVVQTAVLKKK